MTEQQNYQRLRQELSPDGNLLHVGQLLIRAARLWPERIAVICDDSSISYAMLLQRAVICADTLREHGVKQGDRVILFYENSIDFFIAYFAIWHVGGIVAPLNIQLQEAEFKQIVYDAAPALLIISDTLKAKLSTVDFSLLPHVLTSQDINATAQREITNMHTGVRYQSADVRMADLPETALATPKRDPDAVAALLYTSGTTGFPKGVMLSSRNIIINAIQALARITIYFNHNRHYRVYCPLPLFHSLPQNTCVWSNIIIGGTAITVSKIDRKLLLTGITHKPDIIVTVPAMYGLFALLKTIDFGPVKYFVAGGDALSDKIRAGFALLYRRKICNGYGLTETTPFIAVDFDDYTQPTNTIGKPFIDISCEIRNEQGKVLPHGEIGTLWVSGENIMLGYYNAPEATAAVLHNNWLCTGDLAYIDHNGKLVLAGRERDLIINKGVKIYPQEVENILLSHALVTQAAVIGIKHNGEEEIPVAFIGTRSVDHQELVQQLKQLCAQKLAFYKVPREFILEKELPVTATGKVDKKKLKAAYLGSKK